MSKTVNIGNVSLSTIVTFEDTSYKVTMIANKKFKVERLVYTYEKIDLFVIEGCIEIAKREFDAFIRRLLYISL